MSDVAATQSTEATSFEELLEYLKLNRGFDFTGYKRSSLERRIVKRMQEVGIDELRRLPGLPRGPSRTSSRELFNTILHQRHRRSSATRPSWDYLAERGRSRSCSRPCPPSEPIRVWCAGCASGEEAYTRGHACSPRRWASEAFRARVKIYATDVDEEALAVARHGTYTESSVEVGPAGARRALLRSRRRPATCSARTCAAR